MPDQWTQTEGSTKEKLGDMDGKITSCSNLELNEGRSVTLILRAVLEERG